MIGMYYRICNKKYNVGNIKYDVQCTFLHKYHPMRKEGIKRCGGVGIKEKLRDRERD